MSDAVLIVNAGSSSLKWSRLARDTGQELSAASVDWPAGIAAPDVLRGLPAVVAVGHRFVHGGSEFLQACLVDDGARQRLAGLASLDPLHLPRSLELLDATRRAFPGRPQVAAFDTSFHAAMPPAASLYPLPFAWSESRPIRRFGFHGLSVDHAVGRAAQMLGAMPPRLVVCHLGSGCSMTAVHEGRSVDTTMGFSPLDGLMMSTRSGSLDPALVLYLLETMTPAELTRSLQTESGLLGVSGYSADLRKVLAIADGGSPRARLAYAMFLQSLRRGLGSMIGSLGGLDALVFTGGIGEHSARVRRDLAAGFAFAGVTLRPDADDDPLDASVGAGPTAVLVIRAREELVVLRELRRLLADASA